MCHIPPGNPANAHTIYIDENAVSAHLAHGDVQDACECIAPPTGDDDDDAGDDADDAGDDDDDDECTGECTLSIDSDQAADASLADVTVTFMCDMVHVVSSKDLSNVVVEYDSGLVHKFDGLTVGTSGTFGIEGEGNLVTVWVKSGSFQSGDGPGFGYRFDVSECTAD